MVACSPNGPQSEHLLSRLHLDHFYIDDLITFCYIKNYTITLKINMPNNPSPSFKSDWVYQFHVITNGKKPIVGYASEADLTVKLIETKFPAPLPGGLSIANLNLTFKGSATTTYTMGKGNAFLNQREIRQEFERDIRAWLSKCNIETTFNAIDFSKSITILITTDNNKIASNSTTISENEISNTSSIDTGNNSSINNSTRLNKDGTINFTVGNTADGNETSVSTSFDKPMTLIFKFSPNPIKSKYNQTSFEGTMELEFDVTIYPIFIINNNDQQTAKAGTESPTSTYWVNFGLDAISFLAVISFGVRALKFLIATTPAM